jgi:hypothetical protein
MKLLRLQYNQGLTIPQGSLAIELPFGYYPELLEALILETEHVGEFICVEWIENHKPGYYAKARFTDVENPVCRS